MLERSVVDLNRNYEMVIERRTKPRMICAYSALVRSYGAGKKRFQASGTITNLSAAGFYIQVNEKIEPARDVFVTFSFSPNSNLSSPSPLVAARGQIIRMEPCLDGTYGVAVKLMKHRFL